jgi:polysaccharide biosynthesis protein PelA
MRRLAATIAIACLSTLHAAGARRTASPGVVIENGPVSRTVLALYDSAQSGAVRTGSLHGMVDMPLGHLGMVVRYHDIRRGLPAAADTAGLRGVVTWFLKESLPDPRGYLGWLDGLARRGMPLVVIGAMGAFADETGRTIPIDDVNRVTSLFGWRFDPGWDSTTYHARYAHVDARFIGFERPLPRVVPSYGRVLRTAPDATVALQVEVPGRPHSRSDLVIVSPRGAFVAPGYALFSDRTDGREFRQWYINPFELFRVAFRADSLPKPDTTTLSGRRIYYSHVDGDGWRNVTQIEPYRTRHVISARVVLDEVVRKAPDLPVSIGPIAGDLDPSWAGSAESLAAATALLAQPHVEAAVHTYSHPFDWGYFARPRSLADEKAYVHQKGEGGADIVAVAGPRRPRMYDRVPFSLDTEVDAAVAFINQHLPAGKRVELLQWSGDTSPFEAVLTRARTLGLANINGGDSRFDREYPSAGWVAPLGIHVGREWQVYASNSNENTYTDLWRDRFFGFSFLTKTVENTGAPRRLKPFNLYYHMYSGERLSSLNAVLANITFARGLSLAPIEASRFSRIAQGFVTAVIEREGPQVWRVRQRGALQTIRFDDATLGVDFERSRGVIGQRHELRSLYVALDEREEAPSIALKSVAAEGGEPAEAVPYLVESRWRVFEVARTAGQLRFVGQGFGPGRFVWRWPNRREALVEWRSRSGRAGALRAVAAADGLLTFDLPQLTADPVHVVVTTPETVRGR